MWLSASGDVVDTAIKRGVFARAAKAQVKVAPDLRGVIAARLLARVSDLLGLARRSGTAISGFEKAREWLLSGKAVLVVQAADGSVEERARFIGGRELAVVAPLTAARLGQIFGRDHAVHVAIASGKLARMIEIEAARLAGVAGRAASGQLGAHETIS
jgi:ribosomal protein L7Ae-like RNA K-turn-binding protein